jgi:hypothetical protein
MSNLCYNGVVSLKIKGKTAMTSPEFKEREPLPDSNGKIAELLPEDNESKDGQLQFGEALNTLANYVVSDPMRDDSAVLQNIGEARLGDPDAINGLMGMIDEELSRLNSDEANEQTKNTLNQIKQAFETEQAKLKRANEAAENVNQLNYMEDLHEQQRPQRIEDARDAAHEAIDTQPPPRGEFDRAKGHLMKKFGTTNEEEILGEGFSYDEKRRNQPDVLRKLYDNMNDWLRKPGNHQVDFNSYKQKLSDTLAGDGEQKTVTGSNTEPAASGEQELRHAA